MKHLSRIVLIGAGFLFCEIRPNVSCGQPRQNAFVNPAGSAYSLRSNELEFVENKGQLIDQFGRPMPEVLYSSDSKGVKCYLTSGGMHFVFDKITPSVGKIQNLRTGSGRGWISPTLKADTITLQRLDMQFAGANPYPRIEADDISEGYTNYYLAHCKLTGVRGFHRIIYHDLYPHIDFVVYSNRR